MRHHCGKTKQNLEKQRKDGSTTAFFLTWFGVQFKLNDKANDNLYVYKYRYTIEN